MDKNYCSEKNLPLCLCNFSELEQINRGIFKRNFPSDKMPISYDFRSNYPLCKGGIDVEKNVDEQLQATHVVNKEAVQKLQNIFNPGKGSYCGYCQVVNVESDLKNINRYNSLCPKCKYQLNPDCLTCNCQQSIGFCEKKINNGNYQPQILNKNIPACNQNYVNINDNIKQNYSPYPSKNNTNVGIINPAYNKQTVENAKIRDQNGYGKGQIINVKKNNINKCNQNISLPKCHNNNYMKGYFIGSSITDVQAKQYGFNNINNGCNKWNKYKSVLDEQQLINYDVVKNDFNTLPFGLGSYGIPHDDYLSNDQQCQNLYNNMTKAKCLYGKPFDSKLIGNNV